MDIFGLGLVLAFICVGVHYEGLSVATSLIRRLPIAHRARVVVGLIAAIFAHVYFSFTTYTSLGYGDIVPVGPARFIAGLESLMGLVLIAWTASFTYFEMTLYWEDTHPIETHPGRRLVRQMGSRPPPPSHERVDE